MPDPVSDLFQRLQPNHLDSVFVEKNTDSFKSFKIKHLLKKHTTKQNSRKKVQYLMH